ncbi:carboxylic ester hydrolase [Favolaschia claudopus]|uniref:Carboxylic ester hydrolase n=1 Tax=Favolaschia claudopus TaxID=2862362 RepID=A0AAW0AE13_9AGAR
MHLSFLVPLFALSSHFPRVVATVNLNAPTTSLSYGTFQGLRSGNLTKFLGIPFAEAGRFERPREPRVLHGLQNASTHGPACPQQKMTVPPGLDFIPAEYPNVSEDCLTLDVFRPAHIYPNTKLPVYVWIYGGGFDVGNSRDFDLVPVVERSIESGQPIVAVTINYRLNAFGYLMGKEAAAAGISNLGLRDQAFALKWVQKHISRFGGDSGRVVVGGQSAGSVSTSYLTLDNALNSNKLFHGVWLQSGPAFHVPHLLDDQDIYDSLVRSTNCSAARDTLKCLKHVPFETLSGAINNTDSFFSYRSVNLVWTPRIDEDAVMRDPWLSVRAGAYAKIPIAAGTCEDEGTLFALSSLNVTTDAQFSEYVHSNYFPNITGAQLAELARLYPRDPTQGSPFNTGTDFQLSPEFKRLASFIGDMAMTSPLRFFTQHASARQNVWQWLVRANKAVYGALGATHGSDDPIWFTTTTSLGTQGMDRVLNFVNTLDPNKHAVLGYTATVWAKHNVPSGGNNSSLLVLNDNELTVIADDFREEGTTYLNQLRLESARD